MSSCNKALLDLGQPYPRTCAKCGLGPCVGRPGLVTELPAGISALDVQVAGDHYKARKIQPVEYIHANNLNFLEGCIVKRITRWRDKPAESRFQDLEKIKHEVDLLIELESRNG
jgi:hypothetical protein